MITQGLLPMKELVSHEVHWREASVVYSQLFGPNKDAMNGILFDWRDSLSGIVD
jgi:hypothetical protein